MRVRCDGCAHPFAAPPGAVRAECPKCGLKVDVTSMKTRASPVDRSHPIASTLEKLLGHRLGGHTLDAVIGVGGMGVVFEAEGKAIKVLSPSIADDPEFVSRFQREAEALTKLRHENLIEVYEHGSDEVLIDGVPQVFHCFVMERFDGDDLRHLMRSGAVDPEVSVRVIRDAARGLNAAHEAGIVHRDIKPANILVRAEPWQVKVVDFGVAHIAMGEYTVTHLTNSALVLGTINYMAPEQRVDASEIDRRADVYALGAVCYEMLTGKLPIGAFDPPSALASGLSKSVDAVVMRSLRREPSERFDRITELAERLERALRRRRAGATRAALAAAAVLLALGSGALWWANGRNLISTPIEPGAPQITTKTVEPPTEVKVTSLGNVGPQQAAPLRGALRPEEIDALVSVMNSAAKDAARIRTRAAQSSPSKKPLKRAPKRTAKLDAEGVSTQKKVKKPKGLAVEKPKPKPKKKLRKSALPTDAPAQNRAQAEPLDMKR